MASTTDEDRDGEAGKPKRTPVGEAPAKKGVQNPAWANGLKQLYDSVVDEPLPDSFSDLLAQFDEDDDADDSADDAPGEGDAHA